MRSTFVYDPKLGRVVEKVPESAHRSYYIHGDLPDYISPLSEPGKAPTVISGRRQRREELRRNDLREVDPSEWKGGK